MCLLFIVQRAVCITFVYWTAYICDSIKIFYLQQNLGIPESYVGSAGIILMLPCGFIQKFSTVFLDLLKEATLW